LSTFAPLRVRGFRRLAGAFAINRFGDFLALVALALVVYDRTHSTVATAAFFVALEFVPALVAPALVARLDRIPIGRVLPVLYAVECVLFCVLAELTHGFTLAPFLALVALDGALAVAARALCRAGIAATLDGTGALRQGNALLSMASAPAMAVGGAAGGALVASAGADVALLVNAVTFAVGAVLVSGVRGLACFEVETSDAAPTHWRDRLDEALSYVRRTRLVLVLLAGQALALVFFAMTEPIEVPYTRDTLAAGPGGYGALIAAWGIGVVVGGVLFTWIGQRRLGQTLVVATLLQGAAYLGLGVAGTIEAACAIGVIGGAANGAQLAAIATAVQEAISAEFQARVMSLYEALTTASPGVGYLVGGALGMLAGGRAAFVVAGCGVFAVVALVGIARPWRVAAAEPRPKPQTLPA
jgi:hypothetical protein